MLELALSAGLPVIHATTRDTMNIRYVLKHYIGVDPTELDDSVLEDPFDHFTGVDAYYVVSPGEEINWDAVYSAFAEAGHTLVVVNGEPAEAMFSVGDVQLPSKVLHNFLSEIVEDELVPQIASCLGGLTLKEVGEICALAQANNTEITARSVVEARRLCIGSATGVEQLETDLGYYHPDPYLVNWLEGNERFFLGDFPEELTPRGLLFYGAPGTGKTLGAKYLARELGVPLYRVDLSSMMNKWQGQSESNLKAALDNLNHSAPCIALLDEVEKIFDTTEDSGVTTRMLSQLLWWLQEHKSTVLTVMTCNHLEKLPQELYRPGRVDTKVEFKALGAEDALSFADNYHHYLANKCGIKVDTKALVKALQAGPKDENSFLKGTPSDLTNIVKEVVKAQLLEKNTLTN